MLLPEGYDSEPNRHYPGLLLLHGGHVTNGQHGNYKDWTENGGDAVRLTGLSAGDGNARDLVAFAANAGANLTEAVTDHLAEAERAAEHVPATSDLYRMTLNRTNVAIWRAGLMVELGDGAAAIKAAATIHGWRGATPNRISHHHIDMARARVYVGQRDAALRDLITARRYAPTQVRYHPQVHETVRQLARLDRRRTDSLAELTAWLDHAHRQ